MSNRTKEFFERIERSKHGRCPFCNDTKITALDHISITGSGAEAWQTFECKNEGCGKHWKDVYALIDVQEITYLKRGERYAENNEPAK